MDKSRVKTVVAWALCVLVALFFLSSAWPKLAGKQQMVQAFENWGYSEGFLWLIGVLEALGALLLLWPRSATWGAGVLVVVMIGAIYTHLSTGIGSPAFAILALALAAVAGFLRRKEALLLGG